MKELLVLCKQPKPGEVLVDSQDTEDCGRTLRQLRKVGTDDLDFSWPSIGGGSPPKKAKVQQDDTAQKQATAQAQLTRHINAPCLIEALSADPVNPALKQTLKKTSRCSAEKASKEKAGKGRGSGRGGARRG